MYYHEIDNVRMYLAPQYVGLTKKYISHTLSVRFPDEPRLTQAELEYLAFLNYLHLFVYYSDKVSDSFNYSQSLVLDLYSGRTERANANFDFNYNSLVCICKEISTLWESL
jgi:hypothetical protein